MPSYSPLNLTGKTLTNVLFFLPPTSTTDDKTAITEQHPRGLVGLTVFGSVLSPD